MDMINWLLVIQTPLEYLPQHLIILLMALVLGALRVYWNMKIILDCSRMTVSQEIQATVKKRIVNLLKKSKSRDAIISTGWFQVGILAVSIL